MKRTSYTAASSLPIKLIKELRSCIVRGKIVPLHPQISLTNRCNLNCTFCSCANRPNDEMSQERAYSTITRLRDLGSKAITITGGGEPLLYPHLKDVISLCRIFGIQVGLVTNGVAMRKANQSIFKDVKWCRISVSDDRDIEQLFESIALTVVSNNVDWAFSYVVTANYSLEKILQIVNFANKNKFTHVRLVSDLLDLENVPDLKYIQNWLRAKGVDDSSVIYQGRKDSTGGSRRCLISLLKPFIGTDGNVYPCCGIQYAMENPGLNFPPEMNMGTFSEDLWTSQSNFDGSVCARCYYGAYNELLEGVLSKTEHALFI